MATLEGLTKAQLLEVAKQKNVPVNTRLGEKNLRLAIEREIERRTTKVSPQVVEEGGEW